jgi:hypothetical protein
MTTIEVVRAVPLITEDAKLRVAVPAWTISLADAVA